MDLSSPVAVTSTTTPFGPIEKGSAACSVFHNNQLWVFYHNVNSLNFSWTTTSDEITWSQPQICNNVGIAPGTSPSAVVYKDKLYVFYNGCGFNGTWFVKWEGDRWSGICSVLSLIGGKYQCLNVVARLWFWNDY
jgi:hypothetical protein